MTNRHIANHITAGEIYDYVGGYEDYLVQHARVLDSQLSKNKSSKNSPTKNQELEKTEPKQEVKTTSPKSDSKRKLSYKETQELKNLPDEIALLESEQADLQAKLADGSWFVSDLTAATKASERLSEIENLLLEKLERWDMLESLS